MSDDTGYQKPKPNLSHLPRVRAHSSKHEQALYDAELSISEHFRKQNEMLAKNNQELNERLNRLTNGIEHLVAEMHGIRTGKNEEAFARVAGAGASPDLPTVSAEAALIYTLTASQIGDELGFSASQVGSLLGPKGLGWAGNGNYQEIGRSIKASHTKYWHREVPERLRKELDKGWAQHPKIKAKSIITIFRKWEERQRAKRLFATLELSDPLH